MDARPRWTAFPSMAVVELPDSFPPKGAVVPGQNTPYTISSRLLFLEVVDCSMLIHIFTYLHI